MESRILTPEDFDTFVKTVEARDGYRRPRAFGIGLAHVGQSETFLDTFFPFPNLGHNSQCYATCGASGGFVHRSS